MLFQRLVLQLMLVSLALTLSAQSVVQGVVFNRSENSAVEFANVLLLSPGDTVPLQVTQTDLDGRFQFANVQAGSYRLQARIVSMGRVSGKVFQVESGVPKVTDTLFFSGNSKTLKEVAVKADRPVMQISGDKKIFYVENNAVSAGGTALDVMQVIPLVNVSPEGEISLRGGDNVNVWINGKQTTMGGGNKNQLLQLISAGSIERVEIITNPSSKFDADNSEGIINIVLKENRAEQLNGLVSGSWMVYNKGSANLALGFRSKKVNFSSGLNVRYDPRFNRGGNNRVQNMGVDSTFFIDQISRSNNINRSVNGKMGVDVYITKKDVLGIGFGGNYNLQTRTEDNYYTYTYTYLTDGSHLWRSAPGTEKEWSLNPTLNYKKSFSKSQNDLTFDLNYSYNNRSSSYDYRNIFSNVVNGERFPTIEAPTRSNSNNAVHQLIFTADYNHPLRENERVETGVKSTFRQNQTAFTLEESDTVQQWLTDTVSSYSLRYMDLVNAAYFNYYRTIKNFSYQFGLRAEHAIINGTTQRGGSFSVDRKYFGLFPSAYASYKIGSVHEIQAGYSLKVRRPNFHMLVPFTDITDPQNIRKGNPELEPEVIHGVEATYLLNIANQFISTTVFYRQNNNNMTRIRTVEPDGTSYILFVNQNRMYSYGLEFVMRNQLTKWWEITSNFNLQHQIIDADNLKSNLSNSGVKYNVKGTMVFRIPFDITLQLSGDYSGPSPFTQGFFLPNYGLDAALKKEFLNKRLSVSFSANDILFSRRFALDVETETFTQHVERQRESRTFTFTLSYKFGQTESNQRQQRKSRDSMEDNGGMDMF